LIAGNGSFDGPSAGSAAEVNYAKYNLGDSILKLTPTHTGFNVSDFFTPYDQTHLEQYDYDLGSIGVLVVPGTNTVIGGGKENLLYLCNENSMGKFEPSNDGQIVQSFRASQPWTSVNNANWLSSSPVYMKTASGGMLYSWAQNDVLKAFSFAQAEFATDPAMQGVDTASYPGGALAVSSDKGKPGTNILWATHSLRSSVTITTRSTAGIVRAYDASNLNNELWNSEQNHDRDTPGNFSRFAAPTVANGKVYVATFSNQLAVYGLLSSP
jgi:hypothetical protein